jgi:hypothetical protein
MSENNEQAELIGNVLTITREQLTRSMNLNAELEAILTIERAKTAELQKQLEALAAATPKEIPTEKK